MDASIIVASLSAAASLAVGFLAHRSNKANREANERAAKSAASVEARKVGLEEYNTTVSWYKEQLAYLKELIDTINGQLDRVNQSLAQEQDVSNTLRNEVRRLQAQVLDLQREIARRQVPPPDLNLGVKASS